MTAKRKNDPVCSKISEQMPTHPASTDWSLAEASRKKEIALAQLRQHELAVKRGEVLPIADVQTTWSRIIIGLRNGILSIPNKIRMALPHLSVADVETIRELIRSELTHAALNRGFKPTIETSDDE